MDGFRESSESKPLFSRRRAQLPGWVVGATGFFCCGVIVWRLSQVLRVTQPLPGELFEAKAWRARGAAHDLAEDLEGLAAEAASDWRLGRLAASPVAAPRAPVELRLEAQAASVLRADAGVETDARGVLRWRDHRGRSFERVLPHQGQPYVPPQVGAAGGFPSVLFPSLARPLFAGDLRLQQPFALVAVASPGYADSCVLASAWRLKHAPSAVSLCGLAPGDPRMALSAGGAVAGPSAARGWHVYSAIVDGPSSALFVDGVSGASGDAGPHPLDGLMVGGEDPAEANGRGLLGGLLEVWAFPFRLEDQDRRELEQRLLAKHARALR